MHSASALAASSAGVRDDLGQYVSCVVGITHLTESLSGLHALTVHRRGFLVTHLMAMPTGLQFKLWLCPLGSNYLT